MKVAISLGEWISRKSFRAQGAHGMLERRLHLEDQALLGPAQTEKAPIDLFLQR
jgi:hypothetical protein